MIINSVIQYGIRLVGVQHHRRLSFVRDSPRVWVFGWIRGESPAHVANQVTFRPPLIHI